MKTTPYAFTKSGMIIMLLFTGFQGISQKKAIAINSAIVVHATKAEVYKVLISLNRYHEWSPFLVKDPKQKNYVTGTDGQVGSVFYWEGVGEKSKGYQTLSSLDDGKYLKYNCTIEKPFKGSPVFEYHLKEVENGVEVTQNFNLHLNGFNKFMVNLFGVKKKMTATNMLGLERLKALLEKETALNKDKNVNKETAAINNN